MSSRIISQFAQTLHYYQDYGMRMYDARVQRFSSPDPITSEFPELTPYQFASNSPIWGIDLDGLEFYNGMGWFQLTLGSGQPFIKTPHIELVIEEISKNIPEFFKNSNNNVASAMFGGTFKTPYAIQIKPYVPNQVNLVGDVPNEFATPTKSGTAIDVFSEVINNTDMFVNGPKRLLYDRLNFHANKFRQSMDIVDASKKIAGLVPDELSNENGYADLVNYIYNSELPKDNQSRSDQIRNLGKTLFKNRASILKGTFLLPGTQLEQSSNQSNADNTKTVIKTLRPPLD